MAVALPLQRLSQAYERHARHLPLAVNLLFVSLIGLSLARLAWALMPTPEAARWKPAPAAAPLALTPAQPAVNLDALLAANLFGLYQATPGADLANAPDTRLNLTLLGILAGRGPRDSRALISDGTEEKPYAIGDDVARGATLEAIYPDRVILMRSGKAETLRLNKDQPSAGGEEIQPVTAAPVTSAETATSLTGARDQVLQDPSKASEYIRVQPATQDGQMRGYRVYPGRDRQLFSSVGLRPGDLVTAVNGIELDNAQKALQMLNDLSRSNSFVLTVERGGQVQTVNVSLN